MVYILLAIGVVFAIIALAYVGTTDWLKPKLDNHPLIVAHRGGSGQWPQNSRTAVHRYIAAALTDDPSQCYGGMEIDIVLTKDGVPVLSHNPWLCPTLCTATDGKPLEDKVLIRDLTLDQVQTQYRCGGVPDEDFPEVRPVAESIMTFDEVLQALRAAPNLLLYLDIRIEEGLTATADEYATAILSRWEAAALPNRLYVGGPTEASLQAFRDASDVDFIGALSYPALSGKEDPIWTVLKTRWLTKMRLLSPLRKARKSAAGAVVAPTQAVTWSAAKRLQDAGIEVILFTPNSIDELARYYRWPVDILITDFPDLGKMSAIGQGM